MMKKFVFTLAIFMAFNPLFAQELPDDIDISTGPYGVVPLPASAPAAFHSDNFVNYTKIQCPNGQAIHFVAQENVTLYQIVRARTILEFYLKNIPGSEYGADKTAVINQMGTNEAMLLLMNGSDGEVPEPGVFGQPLYENEMAVEGHAWYQTNNFEHRDASFEEILHLMHDTGIGIDGPGGMPGALPAYQTEIRTAQENAVFDIWALGGDGSSPDITGWYDELSAENSLTQEYLASVIDAYYGLWDPWTEDPTTSMWGIYVAHNRAEIETEDPIGWALLPKFFSPYINVDMIIDSSLNSVFSMTNNPAEPYTHKSQYLQHCYLTGSNNAGLKGNQLYNRLKGNNGNNTLEGLKGNDRLNGLGGENTAIFTGPAEDYTVTNFETYAIVADGVGDRDGVDTLWNMHHLQFSDGTIDISLESTVAQLDEINLNEMAKINLYPNPSADFIRFSTALEQPVHVQFWNMSGELVLDVNNVNDSAVIEISELNKGAYIVSFFTDTFRQEQKFIKH